MSVVLDRPYHFVPPHRGDLWPSFIQQFRIVDHYLRRKEGIFSYECRDLDRFCQSLQRGDGILLAPNHCRYADPLALGWPARMARTHVFAMASWHLFNKGRFDSFAITKMGGFSVNREGSDRQSLETAIDILATAARPLILFPEGTTSRTNDLVHPLLDGVSFIARSAARRRAKADAGRVVMHPVAIKYLCKTDFRPWADAQLSEMERRFCWTKQSGRTILERIQSVAEGFLALKEIQWMGCSRQGALPERRERLLQFLLENTEQRFGVQPSQTEDDRSRIRTIRSEIVSRFFSHATDDTERERLRQDVATAALALELISYPDNYLVADSLTDTRLIEIIQRLQEFHYGKADVSIPLHAVIQFGEAISIPTEKPPRGQPDPVMTQLGGELSGMIGRLSGEANSVSPSLR